MHFHATITIFQLFPYVRQHIRTCTAALPAKCRCISKARKQVLSRCTVTAMICVVIICAHVLCCMNSAQLRRGMVCAWAKHSSRLNRIRMPAWYCYIRALDIPNGDQNVPSVSAGACMLSMSCDLQVAIMAGQDSMCSLNCWPSILHLQLMQSPAS